MPASHYTAYKVLPGDCMTSIAQQAGFLWETLWNDPLNAELKECRRDPNVLMPGDVVKIPEKQIKQESGEAEQRHRFRLLGEPAMLRLRLFKDDDLPRANEPYILDVDGKKLEGTTDSEGKLQHPIPNNAKQGVLTIGGEPNGQDIYEFRLGGVNPVREVSGAQQRLHNLGFDPGPIDGCLGPRTEAALRAFQKKHKLKETGRVDRGTAERLVQEHGC